MVEATLADAAVLARMREAVRVLRAAGLEVDSADDRDSHLRRAVRWQRYSRGPVSDLHRACATDVVRGSLRLWSLAGGVPVPLTPGRSLARVQLSALVRTSCAVLRTDLAAEASGLTRRGADAFEDLVRREVRRVWRDVDDAMVELGLPADASLSSPYPTQVDYLLPPRRRPELENQLTTLLGAGFGTGVALTCWRLVAVLWPGAMPAAGVACGLLGLGLTAWTVLARRLLTERNAAERWMLEGVANLRPVLEEHVVTRMLVAESAADEVRPSR